MPNEDSTFLDHICTIACVFLVTYNYMYVCARSLFYFNSFNFSVERHPSSTWVPLSEKVPK